MIYGMVRGTNNLCKAASSLLLVERSAKSYPRCSYYDNNVSTLYFGNGEKIIQIKATSS